MLSTDIPLLQTWYHENRRDLPWRKSRDPYRIWISETMLQQTTSRAVIPYFEKFIAKFPTISELAKAPLSEVLAHWAGLGYYSRARNLHKAAQLLSEMSEFPRRHEELLELPGFGPYTSRAVSSLAFSEAVGVIDGNVIRVLSRKYNLKIQWWTKNGRQKLQGLADELAQQGPPEIINQALMELGSQICTPREPHCISCPWMTSCQGREKKTLRRLPLKKPKRPTEIWHWNAQVLVSNNKIKLVKNGETPFLRDHWSLPGAAKKVKARPARYDFRHSITHHDIFVQLSTKKANIKLLKSKLKTKSEIWVSADRVHHHAPASLIRKAIEYAIQKG